MAIKINDVSVIDDGLNLSNVGIVTVGSGNSTTVINGNTGEMTVGSGITLSSVTGNVSISGTISAGSISIPASIISITPSNGATDQSNRVAITIVFDQFIGVGTGKNIYIRQSGAGGTTLETIGVNNATFGPRSITLTTNVLPDSADIYPVMEAGFVQTVEGDFVGINTDNADSYSFTVRPFGLGSEYEGGYLICCSGGTQWIIAPDSAEVERTYYARCDAVTRAEAVAACGDWFLPSTSQMQNPGYVCREYWGCVNTGFYWWNPTHVGLYAYGVRFNDGTVNYSWQASPQKARAMRCVAY